MMTTLSNLLALRAARPNPVPAKPSTMWVASAGVALALSAGSVQAASSTYTARWTNTLIAPTVIVDASFSFDPADFTLMAGTDWWYGGSKFSGLTVTVNGSALPAANGNFSQSSFDWLMLGNSSTSATPLAALAAPDVTFALGANGSALGPSAAGGGGAMQVGSGGSGGQEFVYFRFLAPVSAVPEPSAYAMSLAGIAVIGLMAVRRRSRALPAVQA